MTYNEAYYRVDDAIAEIKKPGAVFVMARLTQDDEMPVQVVKSDLVARLEAIKEDHGQLSMQDFEGSALRVEIITTYPGRIVGW